MGIFDEIDNEVLNGQSSAMPSNTANAASTGLFDDIDRQVLNGQPEKNQTNNGGDFKIAPLRKKVTPSSGAAASKTGLFDDIDNEVSAQAKQPTLTEKLQTGLQTGFNELKNRGSNLLKGGVDLSGLADNIGNGLNRFNETVGNQAAGIVSDVTNTAQNAGQEAQNAIKNIAQNTLYGINRANDYKNMYLHDPAVKYGGQIARTVLPDNLADKFLGSQDDKTFLQNYSNANVPTYEQINKAFKNNIMSKEDAAKYAQLRYKLDSLTAEQDLRDVRNKGIGTSALALGITAIPPMKAAATIRALPAAAGAGKAVLKPASEVIKNAALKAAKAGAVNGAVGGAVYGAGNSIIDENINPVLSIPESAAAMSAMSAALAPVIGITAAAAPYMGKAAVRGAKNLYKEAGNRLNPQNYETVQEAVKRRNKGVGLSEREVYDTKFKKKYISPEERAKRDKWLDEQDKQYQDYNGDYNERYNAENTSKTTQGRNDLSVIAPNIVKKAAEKATSAKVMYNGKELYNDNQNNIETKNNEKISQETQKNEEISQETDNLQVKNTEKLPANNIAGNNGSTKTTPQSAIKDYTNIENRQTKSLYIGKVQDYFKESETKAGMENSVSVDDESLPEELRRMLKEDSADYNDIKNNYRVVKAYVDGVENYSVFEKGKDYRYGWNFRFENGKITETAATGCPYTFADVPLNNLTKLSRRSNWVLGAHEIAALYNQGKTTEEIAMIIEDLKDGKSFVDFNPEIASASPRNDGQTSGNAGQTNLEQIAPNIVKKAQAKKKKYTAPKERPQGTSNNPRHGTAWYLNPQDKKARFYSTEAENDIICLMSEQAGSYDELISKLHYSPTERNIVKWYRDTGMPYEEFASGLYPYGGLKGRKSDNINTDVKTDADVGQILKQVQDDNGGGKETKSKAKSKKTETKDKNKEIAPNVVKKAETKQKKNARQKEILKELRGLKVEVTKLDYVPRRYQNRYWRQNVSDEYTNDMNRADKELNAIIDEIRKDPSSLTQEKIEEYENILTRYAYFADRYSVDGENFGEKATEKYFDTFYKAVNLAQEYNEIGGNISKGNIHFQRAGEKKNPSIYNRKANEISENNKKEIEGYKDFVNKVLENKLTNKEKSRPYIIGDTPKALVEAGISDKKLSVGANAIRKAQNNKNPDHNLSKETISNVIEALHNPIVITKDEVKNNETSNNRYGVILDLQTKNGDYVVVSVDSNKNIGSGNLINDIRTIHSREDFAPMIKNALDEDRLLKVNKNKIKDLLLGKQSDLISEGGRTSLIDKIEQKNKSVNIYFQTGWHGTPHDFDEFSNEYMGTGEGAQAHGWGTYIAGGRNTAEGYREKLSDKTKTVIANGKTYKVTSGYKNNVFDEKGELVTDDLLRFAISVVADEGSREGAIGYARLEQRRAEKAKQAGHDPHGLAEQFKELKEFLENNEFDFIKEEKGQLFEVDIPEDDVLLDENKKIKGQSQTVIKALQKLCYEEGFNYMKLVSGFGEKSKPQTGKQIYNNLRNYIQWKAEENGTEISDKGSAKAASELLNKYGIKGITYDGYQDGRCYVIFNDKDVKIVKKYYQGEDKGVSNGGASIFDKGENVKNENNYQTKPVNTKEDLTNKYYEQNKNAGLTDEIAKESAELVSNLIEITARKLNMTISDADKTFGMNIQSMTVDEAKAQWKKDSKLNGYAQDNISNNDINKGIENARGFTYERSDLSGDTENLVVLLKGKADISTIAHETGHVYLNALNKAAKEGNKEAKKITDTINKWLKSDGNYTYEQHEKFAESFVEYIRTNKAPNSALREVFRKFKEWLNALYQNIKSKFKLSKEAKEVFDEILGENKKTSFEKKYPNLTAKANAKRQAKSEKAIKRADTEGSQIPNNGSYSNIANNKEDFNLNADANIGQTLKRVQDDKLAGQDDRLGNNPLDYDYIHNQKTGEKVQIEMNGDIKADKIEPQTISSELPFNSGGGKSETKRHLFNLLKINDNGKKVKNINTNEIVTVNKNTIEKSLSNVGVNESGYKDFVSMLVNIEDLFKTSQKILSHNDTKNVSDTKISRYANIAKVGDNGYLLEFVAKDNGEVSLYSVDMLNKEAVPANVSVNKTSTPGTATVSIADIQNIFKSKLVKKYNNDYKNGIDTDFNPDNKTYHQSADTAGAETNEIEEARKEWQEKGVESKFFKKWFGNSKVVDEKGRPLVVYHGTLNKFEIFDKNTIGNRYSYDSRGFFFTSSKNIANDYSSSEFDGSKKGFVMPVYISAENPLIIDAKFLKKEGMGGVFKQEDAISFWDNYQDFVLDTYDNGKYDGIIIDDGETKMVVAFEPEQIKSVNNQGTFDKSNPNIYFQSSGNRFEDVLKNLGYDDNIFWTDKTQKISQKTKDRIADFKEKAERLFNNTAEEKEKRKNIKLGMTPVKIVEAGAKAYELDVKPSTITKIKNKHNLSLEQIKNIPELLQNPVAVFKSLTRPDESIVVLVDTVDNENRPVIVPIELNKNKDKSGKHTYLINEIDSVYGRNNFADFLKRSIENNNLLKIDKIKMKSLQKYSKELQLLPEEGSSYIITNGNGNFKGNIYFQTGWHGTPHDFDEFSNEYMGTGEGAQAHGWGTYIAKNRSVSEGYRKGLVKYNERFTVNGEKDKVLNEILKSYGVKPDKAEAVQYLKKRIKEAKSAVKYYEKEINSALKRKEKARAAKKFWGEESFIEDAKKRIADNTDIIKKSEENINYLKNLDWDKVEYYNGQLFEVDIPEDDVLLDENKTFGEQPEKVKEAIKRYFSEGYSGDPKHFNSKELKDFLEMFGIKTGRDFYRHVAQSEYTKYNRNPETYEFKSKNIYQDNREMFEMASKKLNSLGIKGITYDGYQDGRCYVIFNDKDVKVIKKYYQETGEDTAVQLNMLYDNVTARKLRNTNIKGAFVPAENLIELFKNADESTIVHEFAHWWLTRLEKYAEYNEELALDLEEVRKFLKNDGGEFTVEQHEKFAAGFEAYIRNGSARSNRLKKIFEDFKNALIQIYDSIRNLVYTEDGKEYSFSEDDVKNLEKLFERLLTTENERIKRTVFDKCDDINEQIQKIKVHQQEEMDELDELWKANISANNRRSDKKRKVEEYLEMAENAVSRVPKEVKELKKRYKDVTIDILSEATGFDKRFIVNPKNLEKVQNAIEKVEDKITVSGGMREEWKEFYTDTGVSYDTDETGGDYELAQTAFEVFASGNYNFNNQDEDEIGRFYGKFEYLYDKVLSLKGEEKSSALQAVYSLFDNMPSMPDEVVVDMSDKLSKIEYDYEEGQKEDFNRKRYPNIDVTYQLQYYVTKKLDALKVYNPDVKHKVRIGKSHSLYKLIKNATSVNATKKAVRKINAYVISDLENRAKNILHKEIQKQIKLNSKLVKIGTIKKGKFDWRTNTVFQELAEINKMNQKEALREYAAITRLEDIAKGEERETDDENPAATIDELNTDFESNLKRKFIEYRSNKVKDGNLLLMRSLLEDIMTLKFEGRRAKDEYELKKALQTENMKTDLVERVRALKNNRAAKEIAKFIMGENVLTSEKTLVNWETALNALFGKEVAQRYSLLKLESDAEVYAQKRYSEFCKKAMDIYGLNNYDTKAKKIKHGINKFIDFADIQPLVQLMREYAEECEDYKETTYSAKTGQWVESGVRLSKADIITLYAWSQNEQLEQRIITQYGLHQVQDMFNKLSEQDKRFAWLLIDTCENMYDDNNEVFIRTLGLSLPKVENYFPSQTVRTGSEVDMLHENVTRSNNPSFIKERKVCSRIKMRPDSPLSILLPHINKTARYVVLSERVNYLNKIFNDGAVRAAIKEVFDGIDIENLNKKKKKNIKKGGRTTGDRIHDALLNQLGCSTYTNYARGLNTGKSLMDCVASNYITSRIGGNLKVMFGQLTSVINYCENMPSGTWVLGFKDALLHPKDTIDYVMKIPYIKARFGGNFSNEFMKQTIENSAFAASKKLKDAMSLFIKLGDIGAIIFGGKPYIDYLIEKEGLSEDEAIKRFIISTNRSQQSSAVSSLSNFQIDMTRNPVGKLFIAFKNSPQQYVRMCGDAIVSAANGDITKKQALKLLFQFGFLQPFLYAAATSGSLLHLLFTGDDDDIIKDATVSIFNLGSDALPFIGDLSKAVIYGLIGDNYSGGTNFFVNASNKLNKLARHIKDNKVTLEDIINAVCVFAETAGIPLGAVGNALGGIYDMSQGKYLKGALRTFGYSKHRAEVITGEKE